MYQMVIIGHETTALSPLAVALSRLACHSRSAWTKNFLNIT